MQRTYRRLITKVVKDRVAAGLPGIVPDGDGLYLSISKAGLASRSFKYMIAGRQREMGLGPVRDVGLKRARELAQDARQLKREGTDPLEARREKKLGRPRHAPGP